MPDHTDKNLAREQRLAAKLRENLRRRKAQARDLSHQLGDSPADTLSKPGDGG